MELENLKALVYGNILNDYQKKLAVAEFEKLASEHEDALDYINDLQSELNHKDKDIN